jgi:hypothetical protein
VKLLFDENLSRKLEWTGVWGQGFGPAADLPVGADH